MAIPTNIESLQRFEIWLPGDSKYTLALYNLMEPPKKTLSRLAAFKPPTYGGRPDITKQHQFQFFTWEIVVMFSGLQKLQTERMLNVLDALALNPTQQFAMLKDFYSPTSLGVRPDLASAVLETLPNPTPTSILAPFVYTAHNVVITDVQYERESVGLSELGCLTTFTIQEVR